LKVPITRDIHSRSLSRINRERAGLAKRGLAGQLAPEELTESVFPLSNSWILDLLLITPNIKPPQRAPLATGALANMPVACDSQIAIRAMTDTVGTRRLSSHRVHHLVISGFRDR
jgi:pyruvate/2-oxoglutarate dehydrogenase complex dihydrolipoamide acyltransferase (E2) component